MANRLKVDKERTSVNRYIKGLSIAEFEDVEDAVNEALEDPTGTFSIANRTNYVKMSAIHKDVRSIKRDTLYIRKAVDDIKKNSLDAIVSGSGSGSGVGSLAGGAGLGLMGWLRGILPKLVLPAAVAASQAEYGVKKLPITPEMRKQFEDFAGWKNGAPAEKPPSGVNNFVDRIAKEPASKNVEDRRMDNIDRQRAAFQDRPFVSKTVIKEPTPSERTQLIVQRLKMMTQTGQPYMNELGEMVGRGGQVAIGGGVSTGYSGMGATSNPEYTRENSVGSSSGGGGQMQQQLGPQPSATPRSNYKIGTTKDIDERMVMVYNSFKSAGFSDAQAKAMTAETGRENGFNPNYLYGTHIDPANGAVNIGMFSWQGSRGKELYAKMQKDGLIGSDGKIVPGQEALNAMAKFSRSEIENNPAYAKTKEQFLANPNIDSESAARVLGKNYIRWRIDDPRYAHHNTKRQGYFNKIEQLAGAVPQDSATPLEMTASNAAGLAKVNESYGSRRPGRPDESIRNAAQQSASAIGMPEITFTSGKGNWISESGRRKGQKTTMHSTGLALDVAGFQSDEQRLKFIEEATARGVKGIGVYKDGSIHIDYGKKRSWSWGGIPADELNKAVARGEEKKLKMESQQPGTIGPQGTQLTEASIVEAPQVKPKRDLIGFSRGTPATETAKVEPTKGYKRTAADGKYFRMTPEGDAAKRQDASAREMLDNMIAGQKKPVVTADMAPVSESNKVWNGIKKWWTESNFDIPKGVRHGVDYNYASGLTNSPEASRPGLSEPSIPGTINGMDYDYAQGKSNRPLAPAGVGFITPDLKINAINQNMAKQPSYKEMADMISPTRFLQKRNDPTFETLQKSIEELKGEIATVKTEAAAAPPATHVPSAPTASKGLTKPPRTFQKAILTTAKPAMNPTDGTQGSTTTNIDTSYRTMSEMIKPQLVADGPTYDSLQQSIAAQQ